MPVTDLLERNHKLYSDEVALVELNPMMKDHRKTTWKEYDLVQQTSSAADLFRDPEDRCHCRTVQFPVFGG